MLPCRKPTATRSSSLRSPRGNSPPSGDTRRKEVNDYFGANYFRFDDKVGDLADLDDLLYYHDRIHQTELGNAVKAQRVYDFLLYCQPSATVYAMGVGMSDFLVLNHFSVTPGDVAATFDEFIAYAVTDDEMPDISLHRISAGIRDFLVFDEQPTALGDVSATMDEFTLAATGAPTVMADGSATMNEFTAFLSDAEVPEGGPDNRLSLNLAIGF